MYKKIINNLVIILSLLVFLFGIYKTFSLHLLWMLEGEKIALWSAIKLHFHWWYWFESYGLIYDLGHLLYYLPFLFIPIYIFWRNRIKKDLPK